VLLLIVSVALLGFAPAPLPRQQRQRDDLTDVNGTWEFLVYEMSGRAYDQLKTESDIEMTRDSFTFVSRNASGRTKYLMRLDPRASPPSFTWSKGGGVMFVGSYRLERDRMTMIFRYANRVELRPTDFSGAPEYHYVLRRVKR
jgi:uncharacterized protein (TIGR03067 family)